MKTILVVEDDNLVRKVIEIRVKQILDDSDIEIITAADGNEAMEKYQALKPKVVILDLVLPGINGFDIMVQIKDDIKSKKTIVVALSNLSGGQDMARAKNLGAVEYFVKSNIDMAHLAESIKKYL